MFAVVNFVGEAFCRSVRDLVNPLLFFVKALVIEQIQSYYPGDLAVVADNSHQKSDRLCNSVEIYPSQPQHLVTHTYHRRNRNRRNVRAKSKI